MNAPGGHPAIRKIPILKSCLTPSSKPKRTSVPTSKEYFKKWGCLENRKTPRLNEEGKLDQTSFQTVFFFGRRRNGSIF